MIPVAWMIRDRNSYAQHVVVSAGAAEEVEKIIRKYNFKLSIYAAPCGDSFLFLSTHVTFVLTNKAFETLIRTKLRRVS